MGTSQVLLISLFLVSVLANELNHKYADGEEVIAWISRLGPIDNLQEEHLYYSLPFCQGPKITDSHQLTSSEILHGIKLEPTGYEIGFKTNVPRIIFCMVQLHENMVEAFTNAVKKNYGFRMLIDGMPIWGKVGITDYGAKYYIYTHKKFEIGYNGHQIVDVNLTMAMSKEIVAGAKIMFSYEVEWKPSPIEFKNRSDIFQSNFLQYRIDWISITYTFIIVLFLLGLILMMLMSRLRKNSEQYNKKEEVLKALSVGNPS